MSLQIPITTPGLAAPGALPPAEPRPLPLEPTQNLALMVEIAQLRDDGGDDAVNDHNGAPTLPVSYNSFSSDELALVLAAIDIAIKNTQGKTAQQSIEHGRAQTGSANTSVLGQLTAASDAHQAVALAQKQQQAAVWVEKVASFIGASAAVVLASLAALEKGDEATPLLALAVGSAIAATAELAQQIQREAAPGSQPVSLESLIGEAAAAQLNLAALTPEARAQLTAAATALSLLVMQPELSSRLAEQAALANGQSADAAAQWRLGLTMADVVTTVVAMITVTVGGSIVLPADEPAAEAPTDQIDPAITAAAQRLAPLVGSDPQRPGQALHFAEGAEQQRAAAQRATQQATTHANDAAKLARQLTQLAQTVSAQVLHASRMAQAVANLAQDAGEDVGVSGQQIVKGLQREEQLRISSKAFDAQWAEQQQQSETQRERLRDVLAALQEGALMFSKAVADAGDQRANDVRHIVHG
jgi:hypothetical protein